MKAGDQTQPPTPQQLEAFRFVADWAWSNRDSPSAVHDAAAFALDRSSFAHGFYTPSKITDGGSKLDGDACEE